MVSSSIERRSLLVKSWSISFSSTPSIPHLRQKLQAFPHPVPYSIIAAGIYPESGQAEGASGHMDRFPSTSALLLSLQQFYPPQKILYCIIKSLDFIPSKYQIYIWGHEVIHNYLSMYKLHLSSGVIILSFIIPYAHCLSIGYNNLRATLRRSLWTY